MGIKKTSSLRMAFWKFLMLLIAGLLCAVIIPFGLFLLCINVGIVTFADYSERSVKNIAPIVAAAPDLSEVQLPAGCRYLRMDKSYQLIETTLDEADLESAMAYAATGVTSGSPYKQYLLVTRDNEYVILQYYIGSQFLNGWMNAHLPPPEVLLYILMGINCIAVCIFLTARFSKNLRLQLTPLFQATAKVAEQNLDFEVGHSQIKEFEEVLLSFSNMKDSLKVSLEQQWKTEQLQKEQISALAHDLKTPLTVIQGNADLISETKLDDEQRMYTGYISDSSAQMQVYLKTLIDIARASEGYQLHMETFDLSGYLQQLKAQMDALCRTKEIQLQMEASHIPAQLTADRILLERAIMNVVDNALYYSPPNGTLYVHVEEEAGYLQISIADEGCGFSQDALHHAKEQFYMADQSRSQKMHYGMGLYIADSIMEQHKGTLILENAEETGGAKVTLRLPCQSAR